MKINLKDLTQMLTVNYELGHNTFIIGKPAIGKSETVESFARRMQKKNDKFKFFPMYCGTLTPMDIQATAPDFASRKLVFFNNESLPNAYTDPDVEGVLFLGELPSADAQVVKLLQKYVNGEDMNGVLRKPAGIRVVADGNRIEDRSGAMQQGRAFMSRFVQVIVEVPSADNVAYATRKAWNSTVTTFMDRNPDHIDNYDSVFGTNPTEEAKRGVWANMRSWKRVQAAESLFNRRGAKAPLQYVEASVGSAVAMQYMAFRDMLMDLPSPAEVFANPTSVRVPTEISELYAMTTMVVMQATPDDIDSLVVYMQRLPILMQVHAARKIVLAPSVKKAALSNKSYQNLVLGSADLRAALNLK